MNGIPTCLLQIGDQVESIRQAETNSRQDLLTQRESAQ